MKVYRFKDDYHVNRWHGCAPIIISFLLFPFFVFGLGHVWMIFSCYFANKYCFKSLIYETSVKNFKEHSFLRNYAHSLVVLFKTLTYYIIWPFVLCATLFALIPILDEWQPSYIAFPFEDISLSLNFSGKGNLVSLLKLFELYVLVFVFYHAAAFVHLSAVSQRKIFEHKFVSIEKDMLWVFVLLMALFTFVVLYIYEAEVVSNLDNIDLLNFLFFTVSHSIIFCFGAFSLNLLTYLKSAESGVCDD